MIFSGFQTGHNQIEPHTYQKKKKGRRLKLCTVKNKGKGKVGRRSNMIQINIRKKNKIKDNKKKKA